MNWSAMVAGEIGNLPSAIARLICATRSVSTGGEDAIDLVSSADVVAAVSVAMTSAGPALLRAGAAATGVDAAGFVACATTLPAFPTITSTMPAPRRF